MVKGASSSAARRTAATRRNVNRSATSTRHFADGLFDARPDRLDFRDLPYRPPLRSLPTEYPSDDEINEWLPAYVKAGLILDQGTEGACTGFGLACVVNYLLFVRHQRNRENGGKPLKFEPVSPRMLYELAKRYDEWPGERYEGSSCRGALKGWHKHGVCSARLWPYAFTSKGTPRFVPPEKGWEEDAASRTLGVYYRIDRQSVVDIQAAIAEIGAVYVSGRVHDGWGDLSKKRPPRCHADLPLIEKPPTPGRLGGHAFALVGFDRNGFIVQNSWGESWGAGGFGRLPYDDWVKHGTDAWACALGVPATGIPHRVGAARWPVPSGQSLSFRSRGARAENNPADDPWPIDHKFEHEDYQPWSTAKAYGHTLVTGNDGLIDVRDLTYGGPSGTARYVEEIVVENPLRWFTERKKGVVKLAIYAHGGLNAESESIRRVRALAPYFAANGVYPLFLTWRTGLGETLLSAIQDWTAKIPGAKEERVGGLRDWLDEQRDRAVEVAARLFGRGVWSEMRENAARSTADGHGLDRTAILLRKLSTALGKKGYELEVHLIGHSAGSILLGHLLERIGRLGLKAEAPTIATCTLFAAACSVGFALERYLPPPRRRLLPLDRLWLYVLSDANEKRDGLPTPELGLYGKSLLYLVSRALDDKRKMPILGMERALVPGYEVKKSRAATAQWSDDDEIENVAEWQRSWERSPGSSDRLRVVSDPTVPITREGTRAPATHGSFDNNIEVLTETLQRIAGRRLVAPMEWLDY